jgi:hypothetical protein
MNINTAPIALYQNKSMHRTEFLKFADFFKSGFIKPHIEHL